MKLKIVTIVVLTLIISSNIFAQRGSRNPSMRKGLGIIGVVKDAASESVIEYANIVVLKSEDSTQVNGGITNSDGEFKITGIRPGNYLVKISFIGFESEYLEEVNLSRNNRIVDLGEVFIQPASYQLDDAKIVANRTPVEYKIDKKVINVSEQATTISGSAVDVLENVPSVRVDIEGNVALRGSGSFTLLIDGRPTILDASDALQQIPASSIEQIEIITNPSAKYDPEGVSGIINIISKENHLDGMSGIINGNIGIDDKYGADFTTTYRTKKFSLNIGGDYNTRHYPGTSEENRRTYNDTISSYLNSMGTSNRGRSGWSVRGGGDFNFSKNDILGFSLRYGDRSHERVSDINYHNYTEPVTEETYYKSSNISERTGNFFSSNLNFKHTFGANQHEILLEAMYQMRDMDESTINKYIESDGEISSGRKNIEVGPGERLRFKVDYAYPFSEVSKFEVGVQQEFSNSQDDTKSFIFDATDSDYNFENEYSYRIDYVRNISSIYGIYSGMLGNIGYQTGLRGEYTYREINLVDSNQTTLIDRMDYFPTIHATYKINEIQQLMASYTSRIRRPRGYYLEPFDVWEDANNVRRGNPSLQPEYIDSYELSFLTNWGESLFSIEAYHRTRKNKIERVRSVYAKDVTLRTYENYGKDYTTGTEFMINTDLVKFWNVNLMGDLNHYLLVGSTEDPDFERENFNWSVRLNNTFQVFETTKIQINGQYNSPSVSAQDEFKEFFTTNVAIRQELFNKMLSLTLQVRDVFDTAIHEGNSVGPGYESYYTFKRNAPVVMLNVSLKLNNYKEKKKRRGDDGGDMGDEEF